MPNSKPLTMKLNMVNQACQMVLNSCMPTTFHALMGARGVARGVCGGKGRGSQRGEGPEG